MYTALTALTPDISYNVPIVHPHQCTNIVFGKLTIVPTKDLLSQFHFMIEVNEERDSLGELIRGILYATVNTIDEANSRFEAGTLFNKNVKKPNEPQRKVEDVLPTPVDSLDLVDDHPEDEKSSELPQEPTPEVPEVQEPTPEVPSTESELEETSVEGEVRVKKTEEEMLAMSMDELRAHGKVWDQKSRSRYTLIKEILTAQNNA